MLSPEFDPNATQEICWTPEEALELGILTASETLQVIWSEAEASDFNKIMGYIDE